MAEASQSSCAGHCIINELSKKSGVPFTIAEFAQQMDRQDPLAEMREQFHFPLAPSGKASLYLCGNSLGLQPKSTQAFVIEELEKWQRFGVEGHFPSVNPVRPWVTADEDCRDDMAEIVGALPVEVAIMNSLTVNLHFLMIAFYRPTNKRFKILMEGKAFPSDKFALQSQASFHGHNPDDAILEVLPRDGETILRTEDILARITELGDELSLVMFGGVNYYTGQLYDMEAITAAGKGVGANVGFDLAHAVGNVPLELHRWGCDFACWCNYKFMNSGPGNIGGAFVHERYKDDASLTRLVGWWGHRKEDRFEMEHKFVPSQGAQSFMNSNPPVLCVAALRASTDLFKKATMPALRAKSVQLTAYLETLIDTELTGKVSIITPRDTTQRGATLSLRFVDDVEAIHKQLAQRGIICDVRKPDVMRIGPAPMYNSFMDIYEFVSHLKDAIQEVRTTA
eukprot:TRINITY_DN73996_c0_g1_i1.p1 TRINITY_DN73996_c0_g1~~TRINITY_DN73996_c0_g1_i1.p1  ORF type:complete len:453 (-),score=71.36 TRINITY_DN73996_c0_g1_i1:82-1440(-)